MTAGSVLIVEDDPDIRESLVEVLEDCGYSAVQASNGAEALDALRGAREKPALVLLDIMMPVMDGWGFRAAQKDDPELASIPVVVITAHASAADTAAEMQAEGFLKKPVKLEVLLETVARYCKNHRR